MKPDDLDQFANEFQKENPPESEPPVIFVQELSNDTKENIGLIFNIVKVLSVLSALAALFITWQTGMTFYYLGFVDGWTPFHSINVVRFLLVPCLFLLALTLWRYSESLDNLRTDGISKAEATFEYQTKLWLAIALLVFVAILVAVVGLGTVFGIVSSSPEI